MAIGAAAKPGRRPRGPPIPLFVINGWTMFSACGQPISFRDGIGAAVPQGSPYETAKGFSAVGFWPPGDVRD